MKSNRWTVGFAVVSLLAGAFSAFAESTRSEPPETEFKGDPIAAYFNERIDELGGLNQAQEYAVALSDQLAKKCTTCHGPEGNPVSKKRRVAVPNIASQQPLYLFKQLANLRSGARQHPIMSLRVKDLSNEEMFQLALRFSSLPLTKYRGATPSVAPDVGARIYQNICTHCHGVDGMGVAAIPRLKGQNPSYLITTMTRFRNGSSYRTHAGMAAVTQKLENADIGSLAAYLGVL